MMNRILVVCFVWFFLFDKTFAQDNLKDAEATETKKDTKSFVITSLDNKIQKINIVPDYVNRILRITCLNSKINIKDYWGVPPEITVLNKSFIEIKYAIRAGSNLSHGSMLIVCVSNNKLYK